MKKLLSLLVALSLVLSVGTFASCTSVGNSSTGSDMVATEFAPIAKEDLKIGVMHLGHVADPVGYTAAHKSGIDYMKAELGITDAQVIEKGPVSDTNAEEINATIDSLIADGCNVVIGSIYP